MDFSPTNIEYFSQVNQDEIYMRRCLQLAAMGKGRVAPNPMVGSVIVFQGKIIGEGFHRTYGAPHAEVNAVNSVKDKSVLKDATIYVSLEPCAHFGKTPPCADLIVKHKFNKVVVACTDPFARVAGKGIKKLQEAGIEVVAGVLEKEAAELNRRFFTFHEKKRPYIILKWAQTLNGFMDKTRLEPEEGINWITAAETQKLVHKWRSEEAGILVGNRTVINDNPSLTVRKVAGNNPLRIILDPLGKSGTDREVYNGKVPTLVFVYKRNEKLPVEQVILDKDQEILPQITKELYEREIQSIIVEGGAFTIQSFLDLNLWDEARVLQGKTCYQTGLKAPVPGQVPVSSYSFGADMVSIYRNS